MNFFKYCAYFALTVLQILNINCLRLTRSAYDLGISQEVLADFINTYSQIDYFKISPESDPFVNGKKLFGTMPPPIVNKDDVNSESMKAYSCSLLPCLDDDSTVVCACNFNTGNVVSFKNECDVQKHNCRFDTEFRIVLNEICPWEFQSRRNNQEFEIDYNDPKYYN